MGRLISAIKVRLLKASQRAADQHVQDLESILSQLITTREALDAEIKETVQRLVIARNVRRSFSKNDHGTRA